MNRPFLAAATLVTLMLNGSMALATPVSHTTGCTAEQQICSISLAMMTAPPARPADLADRFAQAQAQSERMPAGERQNDAQILRASFQAD